MATLVNNLLNVINSTNKKLVEKTLKFQGYVRKKNRNLKKNIKIRHITKR